MYAISINIHENNRSTILPLQGLSQYALQRLLVSGHIQHLPVGRVLTEQQSINSAGCLTGSNVVTIICSGSSCCISAIDLRRR